MVNKTETMAKQVAEMQIEMDRLTEELSYWTAQAAGLTYDLNQTKEELSALENKSYNQAATIDRLFLEIATMVR